MANRIFRAQFAGLISQFVLVKACTDVHALQVSKLRARMQSLRSQPHVDAEILPHIVRPADPGAASDLASSAEHIPTDVRKAPARAQDGSDLEQAVKTASTRAGTVDFPRSTRQQTELAWDRRFRQVGNSGGAAGPQSPKSQPLSDKPPAPMDAVAAEQALLHKDARNIAQVK